ncbi:PD-(D/E)XK motif protein [Propionivibrio sp.]|uniref:PD-(D/E)XK motif protein n=1 Tax=Propionivibrio sp. TaxID=2212460 RepID=UPI003BF2A59C
MDGMSIWEKFEALEHDTSSGLALSALSLPSAGAHYLAKGSAGEPILLLRVQKRRVPRIPLGLRHVQVEFEVECAVNDRESADSYVTATFCRAVCDPTAPGLHALFIHALAGAVEGLPPNLTPGEVDGFFEGAVELFRSFSSPAKTSVLGLWGELLVIIAAPSRDVLVTGWHVTPEETFDFAFPGAHLEVKTTARPNRQHDFALTQLRGELVPTFVASIVVEQSDAGENVFELAYALQDSLTPHNRAKLWRLLAQSVGSEAEGAGDIRYLRTAALNSLRFYDASTLPAPEIFAPATLCISNVRFSLDLDRVPSLPVFVPNEVWSMVGVENRC